MEIHSDHTRPAPATKRAYRRVWAAIAGVVALVGASFGAGGLAVGTASASTPGCSSGFGLSTSTVIVTGLPGISLPAALGCVGGSVTQSFGVINSVEATVPTSLESVLSSLPGISVYPDLTVSVQSTVESTAPHTPSDVFLQETGADALAASGDTGQGVTVAVLDTGIDNLPDFQGRLLGGVDFTGANNPFQDSYGHGTFVAGLVAGNGASSGGQYSGEAPGADLVSIKVAGASGQTDLATVIQGVVWAITHKAQYNIGVLNMSLGFQPIGSTVLNPLDQAVEAAWNSGIAVVTSAGNAGPFDGTILSPGDDPLAITVGALDDMATPTISDDEMNDFSSVGPTSPDGWVKPDLVTSGRSVVSLGAPGSTIWTNYPSARIGSANFVGSGTSFSAAITSGAAALVLADNPGLTPNQIKARLIGTVTPGPVGNPFVDGHGALDAQAAATSGDLEYNQSTFGIAPTSIGTTVSLSPSGPADTWNVNLWSGSLSSTAWNSTAWNSTAWNSTAWNSTAWNGFAWTSTAWNSTAWNGAAWNSTAWNSTAWNSTAWNSTAWNSTAWNSTAWNSTAWNGSAWS